MSRSDVAPDLVLLGNLLVDDLVFADGTTRMGEPGGAILYGALAASLAGIRAGVCAPVGSDYPRAVLELLAARGVDLAGLRPLGRPGLRTWLLYEPAARRVVHRLGSPTHAEASPGSADLPAAWRAARAFHVAPIPFAHQAELVSMLPPGAWISLDPHDPITEGSLRRWREVLARVDLLFVSDEELQLDPDEPRARLRRLVGGRLAQVALKRGSEGGWFYDGASDRLIEWPPRTVAVVDPTGAGDAFAAGVLARRIRTNGAVAPGEVEAALDLGVALASFALEAWGAAGLAAASAEALRDRMHAWPGGATRVVPWPPQVTRAPAESGG